MFAVQQISGAKFQDEMAGFLWKIMKSSRSKMLRWEVSRPQSTIYPHENYENKKKTTSEIIFFYESDKIKNKLSIQNSNIPIHMPFFTLLLHTLCFYTCCAIKSIVLIFILFFVHYKCTKNIRSNIEGSLPFSLKFEF